MPECVINYIHSADNGTSVVFFLFGRWDVLSDVSVKLSLKISAIPPRDDSELYIIQKSKVYSCSNRFYERYIAI